MQHLARQDTQLFCHAIDEARLEVDSIIQNRVRDTERMDHLLDHMLGFCCDPKMLVEFKRLCRYYYSIDPQATAGHIHAYREMWDTPEDENEGEGV
jgi:hypothetical protein